MKFTYKKSAMISLIASLVVCELGFGMEKETIDRSHSWMSMPTLFISELFSPFTNQNAQDFYSQQIQEVHHDGVLSYVYNKLNQVSHTGYQTFLEVPLTTLTMVGSMTLGWTSLGDSLPLLPAVISMVSNCDVAKKLYDLASQETKGEYTLPNKIFKFSLYAGAIYAVSNIPAAAAADLQGTFRESCTILKEQSFTSDDWRFRGDFVRLEANCRYDRADHGFKHNSLVVPQGGPCGYLHNNNGTLVATDTSVLNLGKLEYSSVTNVCPELKGSFRLTCGNVYSSHYDSSDLRIPSRSICQYDIEGCKKIGESVGSKKNHLRILTAEVDCRGSIIENCDGTLVIRKAGESDRQCDTLKFKSDL